VFSMLSFFMQYNNPFTEIWSTVAGDGGGGKAQIFMMDPSGNGQLRLTYDVDQDDSAPSVSPDGQRIVFMSDG
ncbi:MAG: hypothetical protein GWN87_27185, partial [Desulfuromonadales bacterium]|nr:hypothetical protein [Desulfuromonadales bacterium]NIS43409.1 hypothetical protein [Desulfuromonadales bacterium]